jgi:hypothetical protein
LKDIKEDKENKAAEGLAKDRPGTRHLSHYRVWRVLYFGSGLLIYLCGLELAKKLVDCESHWKRTQ